MKSSAQGITDITLSEIMKKNNTSRVSLSQKNEEDDCRGSQQQKSATSLLGGDINEREGMIREDV